MSELYYVFAMGSDKRYKAKVLTATESKKFKGELVLCGASFYLKKHEYGLLYCKPEDYSHWETYAKGHGGKIIEWERTAKVEKLYAPNGSQIAYRFIDGRQALASKEQPHEA